MGYSECGWNAELGVWMGYAIEGVCMQDHCEVKIDHGLGYVCGNFHGETEHGCGKYMCEKHLLYTGTPGDNWPEDRYGGGKNYQLCIDCHYYFELYLQEIYPKYWYEEYGEKE